MTQQEMFNKVWQHFIVEKNSFSSDESGKCLYRGPNGEKCAAGLFIDDADYTPDMEDHSIMDLHAFYGAFPEGFLDCSLLLGALQQAHDSAAAPASEHGDYMAMQIYLCEIAGTFELTVPGAEAHG